ETIYHFNSLSISSNWARMAVIMRTSKDSGATWSKARLILPEHDGEHQLSEAVIRTHDGAIVLTNDGGRTLWISEDEGLTWFNPGGNIRGNHPSVAQVADGRLFGLGRGSPIDGRMPQSISTDGGRTFTHTASEFQRIGGGQRLVLLRLREGPLFLASFGNSYGVSSVPVMVADSQGNKFQAKELFAAVSLDGGKTWPHKRVVSHNGPPTTIQCTDGGAITLSGRSSEHRGYLSVCQGLDGVIHLISSRQHYAFNLKWLMTPQPPPPPPVTVKHEVETFSGPDRFDLEEWIDYKSYTGGFNARGQYTINSIMAYGGINRVVGQGSFEANFAVKNLSFHPGFSWQEMSFGFKDKLGRTIFLIVNKDHLGLYFKDNEAKDEGHGHGGRVVDYSQVPDSLKIRFVWNEKNRQIRIFYGLNGAEPTTETPQTSKGAYLTSPFSESNVAYILMSLATADIDHFEIKPIDP
ncbi:MAG: sialidase family protein, partial [Planctomycetota bacterium]